MEFETKLWIIILLVILITLRTFIDLFYSTNFSIYTQEDSVEKSDEIYDEYMFIKSFLDVPFVLISIFLLFNIKFNFKIYAFIIISIINILVDRYFEYLNVTLDANLQYFMERYFTLITDIIILIIGIFILYKIFYVPN